MMEKRGNDKQTVFVFIHLHLNRGGTEKRILGRYIYEYIFT